MIIADGPFAGLPAGHFAAIMADPAWQFETWSPKGAGKSASRHYRTMPTAEICALPVHELAADDCLLGLWAIDTMIEDALQVIRWWGFTYKTFLYVWIKTTRSGRLPVGPAKWTLSNPEVCLLATKGRPLRQARDVRKLQFGERRRHSEKPRAAYAELERLVAGPYLELFSRTDRPGWSSWGDQAGLLGCDDHSASRLER